MEQASQHSSPESSGDSSQMPQPEHPAKAEMVNKPTLDHRRPNQFGKEAQPRPTPRRLHFPTDMDLQEQGTEADNAALAMNPSLQAAQMLTQSSNHVSSAMLSAPHDEGDLQEDFTVDYF